MLLFSVVSQGREYCRVNVVLELRAQTTATRSEGAAASITQRHEMLRHPRENAIRRFIVVLAVEMLVFVSRVMMRVGA